MLAISCAILMRRTLRCCACAGGEGRDDEGAVSRLGAGLRGGNIRLKPSTRESPAIPHTIRFGKALGASYLIGGIRHVGVAASQPPVKAP